MGFVDRPLDTVKVTEEGQLTVHLGHADNTWQGPKQINSGTVGTVWNCPTGSQIHIQSMLVTADGAGKGEIRTSRKGTVFVLEFNEKKSVPLPIMAETYMGTTNHITAAWTPDATGSMWVTAFGHLH